MKEKVVFQNQNQTQLSVSKYIVVFVKNLNKKYAFYSLNEKIENKETIYFGELLWNGTEYHIENIPELDMTLFKTLLYKIANQMVLSDPNYQVMSEQFINQTFKIVQVKKTVLMERSIDNIFLSNQIPVAVEPDPIADEIEILDDIEFEETSNDPIIDSMKLPEALVMPVEETIVPTPVNIIETPVVPIRPAVLTATSEIPEQPILDFEEGATTWNTPSAPPEITQNPVEPFLQTPDYSMKPVSMEEMLKPMEPAETTITDKKKNRFRLNFNNKQMMRMITICLIAILIIAVGCAVYFLFFNKKVAPVTNKDLTCTTGPTYNDFFSSNMTAQLVFTYDKKELLSGVKVSIHLQYLDANVYQETKRNGIDPEVIRTLIGADGTASFDDTTMTVTLLATQTTSELLSSVDGLNKDGSMENVKKFYVSSMGYRCQ